MLLEGKVLFMNYVPLWVKTDYSILSSLIKIDDLINELSLHEIKACAISDDNLFGTMEFYNKCKKNNIKPIIGLEINLDGTFLLYAKNYKGYQNLCNINTIVSEEKLSFDTLKCYLSDLVLVIPYLYKEKKELFEAYVSDIFIGYETDEEKESIDGNKVYASKTLTIKKDDIKYLKYLYKIKDEDYDSLKDVSMLKNLSMDDVKNISYFCGLCNLSIPKKDNLLPIYNDDMNFGEKKYLTNLCIAGLKKRLNGNVSLKYVERLKHELNVIINMGFCNYFLVVWDYVKYAKKNDIMVGPGRGSAASSLVSYSLGITDIDPIKYDLLFERFLNPERVTMPDIDIDFDAEKRDDVIRYVIQKYGKDKVSGIITFSNLLAKQVIRDVARIFDVSTFKVDNLIKNFDDKKSLKEQLNNKIVVKLLNEDETIKKVYDISMHLEGLKRHTSIHAAGVIISSKKLSNYVPLACSDDVYLCGYTMNYIEALGLLKMDFLGLKNLSVIDKIIKRIGDIKFSDIPLDDKKTYELFSSGDLDGVFQFESSGMKRFIERLKPDKIDDLIAAVALFRPGPMQNIESYVARRHGKEKITYIHDDLKEILSSTYGIIIYQEQIMQIASKMAGFSYAEADELRRAMSKKKEDLLLSFKEKFIKQSIKKGYTSAVANEVYDLILKFANYGFNKAHSVSYAIIGYKMAYLKVHYPLYFEIELLNNNISSSVKTKNLINECKRLGVDVAPPVINISTDRYEIKDGKLVYPLSLTRGIGTLTAKEIVSERDKNGSFSSYLNFVKRCYKTGKDVLKNIILSGALDGFGKTRKTLIENLDDAINYAELCNDLDESLVLKPEIKDYDEYSKEELAKYEMAIFGFYISNHPTSKYITDGMLTTKTVEKYFDKNVTMVLYFERKKEIATKNNEKMMFINASDSFGMLELVMFPRVYNKYFNIPIPGVYKMSGKVEKRFSKLQIVLYDVEKM
jgi:DNA polymerase-3 subunit alpha